MLPKHWRWRTKWAAFLPALVVVLFLASGAIPQVLGHNNGQGQPSEWSMNEGERSRVSCLGTRLRIHWIDQTHAALFCAPLMASPLPTTTPGGLPPRPTVVP